MCIRVLDSGARHRGKAALSLLVPRASPILLGDSAFPSPYLSCTQTEGFTGYRPLPPAVQGLRRDTQNSRGSRGLTSPRAEAPQVQPRGADCCARACLRIAAALWAPEGQRGASGCALHPQRLQSRVTAGTGSPLLLLRRRRPRRWLSHGQQALKSLLTHRSVALSVT